MTFDLASYKKKMAAKEKNDTLMLLLVGPQGGGKSCTAGTLGVDTLYLHGATETHGPTQAQAFSEAQITPMCWGDDTLGKTSDERYKALLGLLRSPEVAKNFKAVVIDGLTDLTSFLIRQTNQYQQAVLTKSGTVDGFREGPVTLDMLLPLVTALKDLQKQGVAVVCTMIMDVQQQDSSGGILMGKPHLPTFGIATSIIPQFDDIAIVSRLTDPPNGKPGVYLQFDSNLKRVSKNGQRVEKVFTISPRITGIRELPAYASADLAKLAKFKAGSK